MDLVNLFLERIYLDRQKGNFRVALLDQGISVVDFLADQGQVAQGSAALFGIGFQLFVNLLNLPLKLCFAALLRPGVLGKGELRHRQKRRYEKEYEQELLQLFRLFCLGFFLGFLLSLCAVDLGKVGFSKFFQHRGVMFHDR